MTTIHLTDAQRDMFAACGLIVIDGEQWEYQDERNNWHNGALVAPEGWRILTEPCETCRGEGHLSRVVGQDPEGIDCYEQRACPDCVGGRRVVTLTATCPKCHGDGGYIVHDDQGDECRHGRCRTCGAGMEGGGMVTLGRFTIPPLLPVVRYFADAPAVRVNTVGPLVYVADGIPGPQGAETIDWSELGELPRPGQFIVRPERVE